LPELKIELITVGDEILIGHTLDSNSNWIAGRLSQHGLRLRWHSTVGDDASDLRHQIRRAWNRADIVILTGGLGPTHDDITRAVVARFFNDELVVRSDLAGMIAERFALRGMKPPPGCERLAEFPSRAEPILNAHGSAPGIHYQQDGKELFALPGVPVEMRGMVEDYVIPRITARRGETFRFRVFRTAGVGESNLSDLIGDPRRLEPVTLAFLPSIDHGVTIRISLTGSDEGDVEVELDRAAAIIRERVGEYVYTEDARTLEEVLLEQFRRRGWKLAVAESCTGGMICDRLVSIAGSSDVFERGFITYSNRAKVELLGVPADILEEHGAVSSETAAAMANGARERAGVDVALSVTGIAGPTGGTKDKPVGLVYAGFAGPSGTVAERYRFSGDRNTNRRRSAHAALNLLRRNL